MNRFTVEETNLISIYIADTRRELIGEILFPVFGGEKAAAKIRTVKGLRVEIFSRCARKNTTRPLTVRIVGADEIFRLRGEKAVEKFKKLC